MDLYSDGLIFGWAYIRMGLYSDGLIFGWAYTRMGLYSDGLIFGWAYIRTTFCTGKWVGYGKNDKNLLSFITLSGC